MTSILARQINQLMKGEGIPNIGILVNPNKITELGVTFCYVKGHPEDEHPIFYPKLRTDKVFIKGVVDLTDFPNRPPKLTLFGEMAHCHVYNEGGERYKICFSLDHSFQWFFGSKHMQSSRFNPSVSVKYYLQAVYKFLAEDDLEHPIRDDHKERCLEFWLKYKFNEKELPKVQLPYYESLDMMEGKRVDAVSIQKEIQGKLGIEVPEGIAVFRDYVTKEVLLESDVPVVFGINYENKSQRDIFKVSGFDLMKHTSFRDGVRKTSVGVDFNECFPIVIHSRFWDRVGPIKILDELVDKVFKRTRTNQIIKLNGKLEIFDHYLYIISELFNELAVYVFFGDMFPCEEVLKGFVYFHHLLLVLERDRPAVRDRGEEILDFFELNDKNRDKKVCPNLGILMTQYLMSKKPRDNIKLIDEMFARNALWSLMKPNECKGVVSWDKKANKFVIDNKAKWIELTWKNSRVGMQRFAFQQLYNNRFRKETLETMDQKFGQVPNGEIEVFQAEVKKLNAWEKLSGADGYRTFLEYFSVDGYDLENKLEESLERSHKLGYHSFVVKKNWAHHIK